MPVPKKKTSRSKRDMRRSHDHLTIPNASVCPECGAFKESHRVCPSCGHYKDTAVLDIESA